MLPSLTTLKLKKSNQYSIIHTLINKKEPDDEFTNKAGASLIRRINSYMEQSSEMLLIISSVILTLKDIKQQNTSETIQKINEQFQSENYIVSRIIRILSSMYKSISNQRGLLLNLKKTIKNNMVPPDWNQKLNEDIEKIERRLDIIHDIILDNIRITPLVLYVQSLPEQPRSMITDLEKYTTLPVSAKTDQEIYIIRKNKIRDHILHIIEENANMQESVKKALRFANNYNQAVEKRRIARQKERMEERQKDLETAQNLGNELIYRTARTLPKIFLSENNISYCKKLIEEGDFYIIAMVRIYKTKPNANLTVTYAGPSGKNTAQWNKARKYKSAQEAEKQLENLKQRYPEYPIQIVRINIMDYAQDHMSHFFKEY